MPKLVWAIFCTRASTDSATNNISLFEIIDQLAMQAADFNNAREASKGAPAILSRC